MTNSSYNVSSTSFLLPIFGPFFVSFSSVFTSALLFGFFSTSSLKTEDLRRRLRAVGEDDDDDDFDLVHGLNGSDDLIFAWKLSCFFGMSRSCSGKGLESLKIDISVI